ncbi:MAG: ABC transporter ATP-binding protein [Chitinophagaceae bacterium]|nr:MAG: ABC transporter ATP-binding protein [Chitinophagaceae bacterium]
MIEIQALTKKFRRFTALSDVSLSLAKETVVSLVGPNGSGKTTLIKSILGLVRPDSGRILFDGKSISGDVAYRARIGYMPQIGRYPDHMKIGQIFDMIRNIRTEATQTDNELVTAFGLEEMRGKSMRSLSGGTRQKVSAALAFLFDPPVLILDEPTAGLDPVASELLKDKIAKEKRKGKLVLITSHVLSDLEELTTHVVYLQDGSIRFSGTSAELLHDTGADRLNRGIAHLMMRQDGTQKRSS